ncbi:uncharacterized protein [Henckelia pumila]|uniref:uncharacterized protein n=1 Tax=Henckelia pumila TaxID=405737 RepID=UPI003C6E6C13
MKVRMMLPMSIRCGACGNYIYKGTKFNSRKEDVIGETYLGIQILRFYFKCTNCSAEITYKTDPRNSDYLVESGATRNFEPWRAEDEATDEASRKRNFEGMGDAMKALENKTLDSKRDMDILAALEEIKSMKSRHASVSVDAMLEALQHSNEKKERILEEEDEAVVKSVFKGQREACAIRRIDEGDIDDNEDFLPPGNGETSSGFLKRREQSQEQPSNSTDSLATTSAFENSNNKGKRSDIRVSIVKKIAALSTKAMKKEVAVAMKKEVAAISTGWHLLCQQYESDKDDFC